jgi:hypothetical protein
MHIQKFVYFAQELLALPSDYEFILYQRGRTHLTSITKSGRFVQSALSR